MKKLFLLLVLVCVSIAGADAQGVDMQAAIPADPNVRVGKLDNGMTYYIRHNAKPEKQAEFFIFHNVGAIQEEDSQLGLAHFLEHMAFNGTKNFPDKGILNYLESVGVKFGQNLNAGTGQDMTVYNISSLPATREGILDTALLILHDWSYFITLDPKEIDKERGVIVEELRTGNTAGFRLREKTAPTLFNGAKYAYRNIIGNEAALKSFSYQELKDFYHRWYRTDMQAIVLVGDFDVDQMEAKVKKVMADIPKVENPEPKVMVQIPDNKEPMVEVATDPEQSHTTIELYVKRQPMPAVINDKVVKRKIDVVLDLISLIGNERLFEISQKPDAPFIGARLLQGAITSTCDVFLLNVSSREGESARAFESAYAEYEKMHRFGFNDGELERAKSQLLRSAESDYDNRNDRRSNDFVWSYIENFRNNEAMPSAEVEWQLDSALISSTNIMEVNAIAKQLMTRENQVVIIKAPEKAGIAVASEQEILDIMGKVRAAEFEAYADNTVKEPLISEELKGTKIKTTSTDKFGNTVWTLANGVRVIIKPTDFKADEVLFTASTKGGKSNLTDAEYNSAQFASPVLEQSGVGKFSAVELGKQLAGKNVSISAQLDNYQHSISGSTSPKDMETFLQLLYLYYTAPRFNQADFDVFINQNKSALANITSNPNYIFQDSVLNTLYGHNLRRQIISVKQLDDVKFDKLAPIYNKMYGNAADFDFVFVGNVNLETLKPLVEKYIGSIPAAKPTFDMKDDGVRNAGGDITNRFEVPMQAPKTTVFFSLSGDMPFTLENYLAMDVLKQILSIRYVESIREEKGGTYGVGVNGTAVKTPTERYILQMQFDTDPAMADELMEIITDELKAIAQDGPKVEDMSKVKEFMLKDRPDKLKLNNTWLSDIERFYAFGSDFNSDYNSALSAIDSGRIKNIAAQIVKDGNVTRVVMMPKK